MKKVISALKVIVPLAFGIFLCWYVYNQLSQDQKSDLFLSFKIADYFWVFISILFGILSHISRAYRWKYLLQPLNYKPKFLNSFFSVMVGYGVNLLLPRVGEVTRCGLMSKYSNIPVDKLLGTVVAERIADLLILMIFIVFVIVIELDMLSAKLQELMAIGGQKFSVGKILIALVALGIMAIVAFIIILRKSNNKWVNKLRAAIIGFMDGLKSILHMKNSGWFIFHTILIWALYIMLFYIAFLSLPGTNNAPIMAVLSGFVIAGISMVVVQGGIGVYHAAVTGTLVMYGISESSGFALTWLIWGGQTLMIIILSCASMILLPIYNKKAPDGK